MSNMIPQWQADEIRKQLSEGELKTIRESSNPQVTFDQILSQKRIELQYAVPTAFVSSGTLFAEMKVADVTVEVAQAPQKITYNNRDACQFKLKAESKIDQILWESFEKSRTDLQSLIEDSINDEVIEVVDVQFSRGSLEIVIIVAFAHAPVTIVGFLKAIGALIATAANLVNIVNFVQPKIPGIKKAICKFFRHSNC